MPISTAKLSDILTSAGFTNDRVKVVGQYETSATKEIPFVLYKDVFVRIRVNDFSFSVKDGNRIITNPFVKSLDIYYSENANTILKLVSVWPNNIPVRAFPSIESQETQWRQVGESVNGIPATLPHVNFVQALRKATGTARAKQIVAYYVLMSSRNPKIDSVPVWVIHAWGMPPLGVFGLTNQIPGLDQRRITQMRTLINADTGDVYFSDTIPQPQ